jgi:hypothetical protein
MAIVHGTIAIFTLNLKKLLHNMIYLNQNSDNNVITNNITDYITTGLTIHIDNIYVGDYQNISSGITYIEFILPSVDLQPLNLQNIDYTMSIIDSSNGIVIKVDKVQLFNMLINPTPTFYQNNDNIIYYEQT